MTYYLTYYRLKLRYFKYFFVFKCIRIIKKCNRINKKKVFAKILIF